MLKTHLSEILADASDFLRAWALVDGTECVVAVIGQFLELRVDDDDTILRSARFGELRPALDTAQLWRIEWETGWSRHIAEDPACPPCPTRKHQRQHQWTMALWDVAARVAAIRGRPREFATSRETDP